ncbi:hypothetical protein OHC33_004349 [Knufia fluminis]|uniref:3'-5' exonuclease domain-containing protein n=1 Tax=Knufia fluminis TaxID=191047 RepID=A0AAN8EMZ1_9EURO|nr:hypothetical protein OHC33_004349 [Knufia fluminis]
MKRTKSKTPPTENLIHQIVMKKWSAHLATSTSKTAIADGVIHATSWSINAVARSASVVNVVTHSAPVRHATNAQDRSRSVSVTDFKVMVEGRLIENVDTAQLVTRRVRHTEPLEGGPTEGETLVLRGDLKSCRVLVIRKPSVILSTVYRAARGSVISRYENAWQKLMATTMYQRSKPWYDAMLCYLEPEVEATHVNVTTVRGVRKMVTELAKIAHDPRKPTIGFDCEGDNLGRYGTTCYIQIRDYTKQQTYLVDLLFLGQAAWETVGCDETTTLRTIFENQNIVKIIFDVRGDSNALYKDYKIRLAGVLDMQYLALLGMAYPRRCRVGFVTTIRSAHFMSNEEKDHWLTLKNHKFKDNDYSVFKKRPLPKALKLYAVNDVIGVDKLAAGLTRKLTERGVDLAFAWTQKDIEWTWEDEYENREEKTPRGFDACWNEDINQYTHRAITGAVCYSQTAGVVTAETVMGNFPYVPVSLANAETHPQNAHVRPVKSVLQCIKSTPVADTWATTQQTPMQTVVL